MNIRALSFDFDGCLFHSKYRYYPSIISANKLFLDQIKTENQGFHNVITYIGSARQSKSIDAYNSGRNRTRSCFAEIMQVSRYVGGELDRFLLADIERDLESGESFNRTQTPDSICDDMMWCFFSRHPNPPIDHTKFTLLYAQTHKIALKYPQDIITFDFYDDRSDILNGLKYYFTHLNHLLPKNVNLRLNKYRGAEVTLVANLQGSGEIDQDYRKTIKNITRNSRQWFTNEITSASLNIPKLFLNGRLEDKNELPALIEMNPLHMNRL